MDLSTKLQVLNDDHLLYGTLVLEVRPTKSHSQSQALYMQTGLTYREEGEGPEVSYRDALKSVPEALTESHLRR